MSDSDLRSEKTANSLPGDPGSTTAALDAGMAAAFAGDSMESWSNQKSVLASLGRKLSRVPRVVLKSSQREGSSPIIRPRSKEMPSQTDANGRYRIDGEIARGGMGAILKGRDTDLGRDLAVKVLLESHKDKPEVVERFIEEAQIGGQLQHPGIVPVYELGQFDDERPFFSMKLVKGKTLSALLSERESFLDERAKFLGIFEQICQTMAYAHSRGVIHRDLKPANIMVGAFGEVQVMDWGLAKVLGDGGVADERKALSVQQGTSIIETIRSQGGDTPGAIGSQTQLGSILGTPAYMPPEQALGETDVLDERVDVFGLGAILCEILTGKPPYVADDPTDVYRMASRGKLGDCLERVADSGADQEITDIIHKCLEVEPGCRLRDAGVVNSRFARYLQSAEERLHQAELDRLEANTRAIEEAKRRRISLALAASIILTLGVATGAWTWVQNQRHQLAQVEAESENNRIREKEKLNGTVRSELTAARAIAGSLSSERQINPQSLEQALKALHRVESVLHSGDIEPSLAKQVESFRTTLRARLRDEQLIAALEDLWEWEMERLAEKSAETRALFDSGRRNFYDENNPSTGEDNRHRTVRIPALFEAADRYERAFADWGIDPETTSTKDAVRSLQALDSSKRSSVLVSLDRWRRALLSPRRVENWEGTTWSVLEPVTLTSPGGDEFEVLDDKSILASGDHPEFGYQLVFETDQQTISAFRLDTLLHDSLPHAGPGRGPDGHFNFYGLKIHIARASDPGNFERAPLDSAVADHSLAGSPITAGQWGSSGGEPHFAIYALEEPLHSESGFRVAITFGDKIKTNDVSSSYAQSNLGRFRWSTTNVSETRKTRWIAETVHALDDDPWRQGMRSEIAAGDVNSLLERVADEGLLATQPRIVQVELAEILRNADLRHHVRSMLDDYEWEVLEPLSCESEKGTILEVQEDGSVFASGPSPAAETYIISAKIGNRPLHAIRLETIQDERLPGRGYIRGGGQTFVSEFVVSLAPAARPDTGGTIAISRAFESQPGNDPNGIRLAIDESDMTSWKMGGQKTRHGIFLLPNANTTNEECQITVKISFGGRTSFGRFRLLVTHDDMALPDFQQLAIKLLRRMQVENPNDYWVNLALSQSLMRQAQPQLNEAIRYSTAAVALRPNRPNAHYVLLRQLIKSAAQSGGPIPEVVFRLLQRARDLSDESYAFQDLADEVVQRGMNLYQRGETTLAMSYFRLAETVDHDSVNALLWLAWMLVNAEDENVKDPTEAVTYAKRALGIRPENANAIGILGYAHYRNNRFVDAWNALETADESLDHPAIWLYMAMTAKKLGNEDEALAYYDKANARIDSRRNPEEMLVRLRTEAERVLGIDSLRSLEQKDAQGEKE